MDESEFNFSHSGFALAVILPVPLDPHVYLRWTFEVGQDVPDDNGSVMVLILIVEIDFGSMEFFERTEFADLAVVELIESEDLAAAELRKFAELTGFAESVG